MQSQHILLVIALMMVLGKLASGLSIRLKQPPVLGMLILGLVLGPSGLRLLESEPIIQFFSEIGVIFLLFTAGLETDLAAMKRTGKSSFSVALAGMILPFGAGMVMGYVHGMELFPMLVLSTILTATSVSVSVMTLLDLKKLRSVEGTTIMSAAVIDDVLGILLLTFIFGFASQEAHIGLSVIKIAGFIAGALLAGIFLINPLIQLARKLKTDQGILSIALALCLIFSWAAEQAEVASITGAYLAGLFLGRTNARNTIIEGVETLGQSLFVGIFFINIGLETHLWGQDLNIVFVLTFSVVAAFTKFFGSGLGARISGFSWSRSLPIGIGMMPRGEVGLIIANMALAKNVIGAAEFSATVFMVILTALITPFLLKWSFLRGEKTHAG